MIHLEIPATASCDWSGPDGEKCEEVVEADCHFNTTGTFGFALPKDWQALPREKQLSGPWLSYCPKHHQERKLVEPVKGALPKLQIGPAGPRIVLQNPRK